MYGTSLNVKGKIMNLYTNEYRKPDFYEVDTSIYGYGPRFGNKMEHAIVRKLIRHLDKYGFVPHSVAHDDLVITPTQSSALWEVFEVDDCILRFRDGFDDCVDFDLFGVKLMIGEEGDMISDWSWPVVDRNNGEKRWNAAMSAFDATDIYK